MNGAPGSCRPPRPRHEMLASREPRLLLRESVRGWLRSGCFSPTPGNRGWPWGGLRALDRRRRRADSQGIGRLTSDIGLRPNARCPARERGCDGGGCGCWPLASTPAKPRDLEKECTATSVAPCTLPKLHGRRGSWCRGVFPFWKWFLENLAPQWVDGYLNHRLLWLRGIKCKGKVCFHPRSFSKAMKYFVTTFYRHCTGRAYFFRVEGKAWAPWRQGRYHIPVWSPPWLLCTRIERNQPSACFDDSHQRI